MFKPETTLKKIPTTPGVYLFRDKNGAALYVGKAGNLKNRLQSYFQESSRLGPKTELMVGQIAQLEHFETASEIEAFLLEADLIKLLKPKYNKQLKDDKAYPMIQITREAFPRVVLTRKREGKADYFGPFPYGSIPQVLRTIRRAFPYRDCVPTKFRKYQKIDRGCLFADLKLCPAPCTGKIEPEKYGDQIKELKKFLRGQGTEVIKQLESQMADAAEQENFEEASRLRDRISKLKYIRQRFQTPTVAELDINLAEDLRLQELTDLKNVLKLTKLPQRIEAYDISNISGKQATGSMVVFVDGEAHKDHYRRFRIRLGEEPDDTGMIKEVLNRRFSSPSPEIGSDPSRANRNKDESFASKPDLVLIDGGRGQLNAALQVLGIKDIQIPVISLAKREELIFTSQGTIRLGHDANLLQLLQRIRDESHRFALAYHHKLTKLQV